VYVHGNLDHAPGGDGPGHMSKPDPPRDCVAAPGNHAGSFHDGRYNDSNAPLYRRVYWISAGKFSIPAPVRIKIPGLENCAKKMGLMDYFY